MQGSRSRILLTTLVTTLALMGSVTIAPAASAHLIHCNGTIEKPTKLAPLAKIVYGGWEVHCDDKMDIIQDTVYLQEYIPSRGWITMKQKFFLHSFDANFIDEIQYGGCASPFVAASWRTRIVWSAYHETWGDYQENSVNVTLRC